MRHRLVAGSWLSGVAVAAVVLVVVPDLLLAAELAFLAGSVTGRRHADDITVAKFVGIGAQDLVAAECALAAHKKAGLSI